MAIRKDETGKRWVEIEALVPGTPEQVWQALATGPGYAAWFVKGEIEPRVGGVFRLDFGQGAISMGQVTGWDPPHRFGYEERDWSPGAPPVATEITITGRAGNRCVVRMVHSLFTSSDAWDDQVEGFQSGWPGFFAVLEVYLAHFAGAGAVSFIAMTPTAGPSLPAWVRLTGLLGLAGANVGERRTATEGPEPWTGIVEHVHQDARQRYLLLRLESPSPGVVLVGTSAGASPEERTNLSVCRYFYGADIAERAVETEARWRDWLATAFEPAPVAASTGASDPA